MAAKKSKVLPIRGFLIHVTHYDGKWIADKPKEKPFDLKLGLDIVDAMAEADMNLLVIATSKGNPAVMVNRMIEVHVET